MNFSDRIFDRTYGVEIECVAPPGAQFMQVARELNALGVPCVTTGGYTHQRTNEWKITTDRTISDGTAGLPFDRGWEIVAPSNPAYALKGEAGFKQIATICTYLQSHGFTVNKNCGLHVHCDVVRPRALSLSAIKRLVMFYAEHETIIDQMFAPSRRGNGNYWCRSISRHVTVAALEAAQDMNQLADVVHYGRVQGTRRARYGSGAYQRDGRRFVKLNVGAHWLYGTMEFRGFNGTIEAGKISHWVIACLRMVSDAEHSTTAAVAAPVARTLAMARRGSKRELVIQLMLRPEGTTQEECLIASGWRAINLVRMAREYGLALRTTKSRINGKLITRYYAHVQTAEELAQARTTAAQAVTTTLAATPRARNLDELTTRLGMTDDEKQFWLLRAAMFAGRTVR